MHAIIVLSFLYVFSKSMQVFTTFLKYVLHEFFV